jgi:hypothetical protein
MPTIFHMAAAMGVELIVESPVWRPASAVRS